MKNKNKNKIALEYNPLAFIYRKRYKFKRYFMIYSLIIIFLLMNIPFQWGDLSRIKEIYNNINTAELKNIFDYEMYYFKKINFSFNSFVIFNLLLNFFLIGNIIEYYLKVNRKKINKSELFIALLYIDYLSIYLTLRFPLALTVFCYGVFCYNLKKQKLGCLYIIVSIFIHESFILMGILFLTAIFIKKIK